MERQIGRVDMVRWQGRRINAETRSTGRVVRLVLGFVTLAAAALAVGFWSGLPIPIHLLQTVFAVVAISLITYGLVSAGHALMHREDRRLR